MGSFMSLKGVELCHSPTARLRGSLSGMRGERLFDLETDLQDGTPLVSSLRGCPVLN